MRLGISNIAWDVAEDETIAALLQRLGIDAIDVAPSKYFADPAGASDEEIRRVRDWWNERGIEITGMQALLFGTSGLNLFGPPESQQAMLRHLAAVCRIGAGLGATRLVFGSPNNRDRSGLTGHQALAVAVPFFKRLGDLAGAAGVRVCLEPNPARYGANFMMTTAETAMVVELIGHPAIRLQLDTGALTVNGEDPILELRNHGHLIGHIHASEPDLLPLGEGGTRHEQIYQALIRHLPRQLVCVEMLATAAEPHPVSVERALECAIRCYRPVAHSDAPGVAP